jgi:hypothetical protein
MLMTLGEIVAAYIREHRSGARAEMRFFEIQSSPTLAIQKAALCVLPSGKRHPHQRRIPQRLLEIVEARLQAVQRELKRAESFDELLCIVAEQVGSIKGIGALTVYDIAHRIGAHFGMHPRLVYLHAGTRKGAIIFGIKGGTFDPAILPKPFLRLQPYEIEDCLCIYKDELKAVGQTHPAKNSLDENPMKTGCVRERIARAPNARKSGKPLFICGHSMASNSD